MFYGPNILQDDSVTSPEWEFKKRLLLVLLFVNSLGAESADFFQRTITISDKIRSIVFMHTFGERSRMCFLRIVSTGLTTPLILLTLIFSLLWIFFFFFFFFKWYFWLDEPQIATPFVLPMECIAIWKNSRRFLFFQHRTTYRLRFCIRTIDFIHNLFKNPKESNSYSLINWI
jgi:hypothetical protein